MGDVSSNTVVLSATALSAGIGERLFVDNQEILLRAGEKVGLVGRNGAGKSTLLKILVGQEHFFSGQIIFRKGVRCAYLPQAICLNEHESIRENILDGARETLEMIAKYESHSGTHREAEELERTITARDGWTIETRMQELATSLAVPALDRCAGELSGGEKRRVALCRALIDQPELLLLDEPTNHLDAETIEWLEEYLNSLRGTCLFITHDRYFLDSVCSRILELQAGKLYSYPGNYTDFLRLKAEREEEEALREEKRLAFIRREIDWIRRGPKARGTKSWSRIQRFNEAVETAPPPIDREAELLMPPPEKFGDIIAELKHVTLNRGGHTLFTDLSMNFTAGMRLGIIGRNGLGKSSFLKLLLGELQPNDGVVRIGERTQMNYADQHRESLNNENTVVQEIGEGNEHVMFGNRKIAVWTYLRRFLFQDEEIQTRVGELSGGERNRLVLAKILKRGGNFLLLDQPTNDLDLATLRVLEESLMNFAGCAAIVSHDRYFLNRVCTDILAFEDDGNVVFQHGDYQYYLEKRRQRRAQAQADAAEASAKNAQTAATAQAAQNKNTKARLTWKEQRELENMEQTIADAEAKVTQLEETFADPNFHAKYGQRTAELTAELDSARKLVESLYNRWEELSSRAN